jgi:predicted transcriptional regulator of viral defense system
MKFERLLRIVGREPVFHSSVLAAGEVNATDLGRQLPRWVKSGNLVQLRRGVYALSDRYRKIQPHPFLIANRLKRASYVSLQSALGYHGLIPEFVPSITSVTTDRPETLTNPLGNYIFKHIKKTLFHGYEVLDLGDRQFAFVAGPEKALLDLIYLTPESDSLDYLRELRLQNVAALNTEFLMELAHRTGSQKLLRASRNIAALLKDRQKL